MSADFTIQDLFRHTSGLSYGGSGATAVHKMYPAVSVIAADAFTGAEFLDRLSSLPLVHQPGTVWEYGFGLDVLGLIIESITQQPPALASIEFGRLSERPGGIRHETNRTHLLLESVAAGIGHAPLPPRPPPSVQAATEA